MGRGKLSTEELQLLADNPNVLEINGNRIIYSNEFKKHFMQEYLSGKGPTRIFREAGFSTEVIGSKRIERAAARWKEAYFAGCLGDYKDGSIRHRELLEDPELTREKRKKLTKQQVLYKLNKKQKQIQMLQEENIFLKKQLHMLLEEAGSE